MESPLLHLGTGLLRVLGASRVGRHQAGQGPLLQGCGQHKHPPGCETEPGRVGTAPLSPLRVCGYPQQTLAALSPPTKGLFPLWEGSGEPGVVSEAGFSLRLGERPGGSEERTGAGAASPRSPQHLPPSPAGRALPGAPRSRLPLPEPASERRPEPPLLLPSRFLPGGRLPRRPPVHPSCRCPRRGDKAGMATRGTAELGEAPSVINFHQAAPTTAPGIPRWAGRCGGCREA